MDYKNERTKVLIIVLRHNKSTMNPTVCQVFPDTADEPTWQIKRRARLLRKSSNVEKTWVINSLDTEEITNQSHMSFSSNDVIARLVIPEPVYVNFVDGEEHLVYNEGRMEINKMYSIEWNNRKYGLRKTDKGIEFFDFEPKSE